MTRRILPLALCALLLSLCVAREARAEEVQVPPSIDAVEVAKLLLSADDAERGRGVSLLTQRVAEGGADLGAFLAAMARAQASWADDEERLVPRWIDLARTGSPKEQDRARRLLAASGRRAVQRLLAALRGHTQAGAPESPPPAGEATPQSPVAPAAPVAAPVVGVTPATPPLPLPLPLPLPMPLPMVPPDGLGPRVAVPAPPPPQTEAEIAKEALFQLDWPVATRVLMVPKAEVDRWIADRDDDVALVLTGHAVVVPDTAAGKMANAVGHLPDARVLDARFGKSAVRVSTSLLLSGSKFRYRRDLARTGKGAWGVLTDTLPRGLQVELKISEGEKDRLLFTIEARNYAVPTPLPALRVRPAPNVEPMEIDVPEWQVATMRTKAEVARSASSPSLLAFFPELVEGKVVVVSVRVIGLDPAAASADAPK